MKYSVAIRTLGKSNETLKKELISLHNQTLPPEEIIIYIAKGFPLPDFRVGIERYVQIEKGMISQRAHQYDEISAPNILLLDDDIELAGNSAEILLNHLYRHNADCIAADTFNNHGMSFKNKFKAILSGLVFPRIGKKWAFKIHRNGSFSYINNPDKSVYPSQSAAGPCSLWKKSALVALNWADEKWLDRLGFAYGDDDLEFYKLYINGGKLYVSFDSGVKNLDSKSASSEFREKKNSYYIRSMSNFIRWHRMNYCTRRYRALTASAYSCKFLWMIAIHLGLSIKKRTFSPLTLYVYGFYDGVKYINTEEYRDIPAYKSDDISNHLKSFL